uniref:Uncharacterized protein n=1 Tax=Solanum lycopersicum TaxID=4081 RepID=A0A3Q7IV81_SOLLC
WYQLCLLLETH